MDRSASSPFPNQSSTRPVITGVDTIAFDADDTLWHNEDGFHHVEQQFAALVGPHLDGHTDGDAGLHALDALATRERANVTVFGYGVKSFTFSMVEVASALTKDRIDAKTLSEMIHEIVGFGRWLLTRETVVFDDAAPVLDTLAGSYRLLLVSKGDSHHQLTKVRESGLRERFDHIEIVAEKDPSTYRALADKHGFRPEHLVMVGNSVKSDVLPVLDIGGHAVHIPYQFTWALERAEVDHAHPALHRFHRADRLAQVPALLGMTDASAA